MGATMKYRAQQSRAGSLVESFTSIGVGFVISYLAWLYVVPPLFGLETNPTRGLGITILYTVIAIIRSYVMRRVFERVGRRRGTG